MIEEWRPIPSAPGYEASSEGRIRSVDRIMRAGRRPFLKPGRVLKLNPSRSGYLRFSLNGKAYAAHMAVLEAFGGPRPTPQHQCAHWDGDKANNKPANLRWATPAENCADKARHGTQIHTRGELSGNARLTAQDVLDIRRRAAAGERQIDIAAHYKISRSHTCSLIKGTFWKHLGEQGRAA